MKAASEFLRALVKRFEHRGPTTDNEQLAAAWLGEQLSSMGYDVDLEQFLAPSTTLYSGPSVVGLLLVVVAGFYLYGGGSAFVAAALAAVLLVPLLGELFMWRVNLDLVQRRGLSQNVVARLPFTEPDEKPARPVFLVAHYDTQLASPLFAPAARPHVQTFFVLSYLGFFGVPLSLLLQGFWPGGPALWLLWVSTAIVLASSVFLLVSLYSGAFTAGANDNGSGVSVLLAIARRFAEDPVAGLNPTFLLTGAEEAGTRGMLEYMNRHAGELPADTVFINVDNVGGGSLHYLEAEGMLVPIPYNSALRLLADELAREPGMPGVKPKNNLLLPTDGLVASSRGFATITLISFDEHGHITNYHWHDDTLDTVDMDLVDATELFVWRFLQRL